MFDELPTEAWNAASADLDLRDTTELVALMTTEDASVPAAVERASAAIVEAIDAVADRLARGGRLIYVGAGTSGRLALVDAVECESTFAVPPGLVIALVAGGATSAATAQEHAEDDERRRRRPRSPPCRSARSTPSSGSARAAGRRT